MVQAFLDEKAYDAIRIEYKVASLRVLVSYHPVRVSPSLLRIRAEYYEREQSY